MLSRVKIHSHRRAGYGYLFIINHVSLLTILCFCCFFDCNLHKTLKMKLTDTVVRNFLVAKIFRENTDRINSLDYSSNGETLISSSDDDSIIIYDCQNGT